MCVLRAAFCVRAVAKRTSAMCLEGNAMHRPDQVDGPNWSQHARPGQAADGGETRRATGSTASLVVTASESGLGLEQPARRRAS